jgi:hypothetical protein
MWGANEWTNRMFRKYWWLLLLIVIAYLTTKLTIA